MFPNIVHAGLPNPAGCELNKLVEGNYKYYHYLCDGVNDVGWGCGYRTLQTICSWIRLSTDSINSSRAVSDEPTLRQIQEILIELGDKATDFVGSKEWIGTYEAFLVLDYLYDIPCKIIHVNRGSELYKQKSHLLQHFETMKSPIMMGGDIDNASKCIVGISMDNKEEAHLLVVDPHCSGKTVSKEQLQSEGWVYWKALDAFDKNSFYNFCLPQVKPCKSHN